MASSKLGAVRLSAFVLAFLIAGCQGDSGISLFNGKDYSGWEGDIEWFYIQQKSLVAGSLGRAIPQNEFLCTKESYSDFTLKAKFKIVGEQSNGGIQFRSKRVAASNEVSGYQADVGQNFTGSLYDEHRRNKFLHQIDEATLTSLYKPEGEWYDYQISAIGPNINLSIDGIETTSYVEEDKSIAPSGIICIQIHSGPPGEIWYKDISISAVESNAK